MTCLLSQPWLAALWVLPLVVAAASQSSAGDSKEEPKAAAAGTRSRRGAMEELQSQIRWEYGGWRPIMPGSPFFFVKTSRAVSLDGSASALTPVRMRAPQLHNGLNKDDSKPGPLQQLEAPPLAHHYGGLDGDVAHADSQQHFVTARPHDPPNFDRQAPRRPPQPLPPPPPPPPPQHLQQRPPPSKLDQHHQHHQHQQQLQQHHQEYQNQHHQQQQQHSVPYPGYQEHTINAEIVRGRPQGDYDPRDPPRIHVEDVPADVLATGIHPSGHPIRVDGINLNIITPSQHDPPPFPPRHPPTTSPPSPAPVFTHYHRPEDVASAPFFQHQHHQDASHDTHQQHNYNATADATGNKEHYYDHPSYHHDDRRQNNHSHGDPVYHESQKEGHYQEKGQDEDSREPSKEDGGHTSDSETEEVDYDQYTDEITETPAPDSKAITVQKEEDKAQLYHAYYAPAQHKPPPGYVRMTVEEFNRLFKDAEIQFIGSESDLNKKLSGKTSQSKVQYSQTEDKDSQTSTVKIETVGSQPEEKKVAIKTSVSVSTSTSTGNKGAYHSFIQPRENAGRAVSDSPLANLQATTRKAPKTTTSRPSTPENKDNSPTNLFGARLKMPRTQKSQS
ncbi:hypothetical protein HPB50_005384 [Hyalomma asiaticum]|uniref:Uncharacterized protein n=1 Tax=Hyalomma asiaticum TaxID=266040 RepID=A0ACB7SMU0_HYAAI|nr:hypothetical protein HPB50_005384 [Hyalomma asiaticum]